ncbi:unnamed protein product [Penicillium nalgiovense]|uniref:Uncharacterized protein n=1 Tax=Penicillium nalgiovense TaxID=60175 RepID=A0A9W4N7Q3_PENNA|nr:unnamed protein product [Penicillium nalgiovense]CAG7951706.1 unnamed protein product [Penicillium nalgiovense]CAG7981113.1 unnamed protein product [Penicillium nalgiovense]CAG7981966.1 unnamed protein product [Penicillium nalgiovense]CAG7982176.1 unnamed protein product [Penicillium nalgiovense]
MHGIKSGRESIRRSANLARSPKRKTTGFPFSDTWGIQENWCVCELRCTRTGIYANLTVIIVKDSATQGSLACFRD